MLVNNNLFRLKHLTGILSIFFTHHEVVKVADYFHHVLIRALPSVLIYDEKPATISRNSVDLLHSCCLRAVIIAEWSPTKYNVNKNWTGTSNNL